MRTLAQITISLKQAFVTNEVLQQAYGLDPAQTFDEQFSPVSIEAAIIAVIAFIILVHEQIWGAKEQELEEKALVTLVGTPAWYRQKVLEFQDGDELTPVDGVWQYPSIDPDLQIVKRVSLSPMDGGVFIKAAAEEVGGSPRELSLEELANLVAYINFIKMAGTRVEVVSLPADKLLFSVDVYFSGSYTATRDAVIAAILGYLASIPFDGSITRGNIITEINNVTGVDDVYVNSLEWQYGANPAVHITRAATPASGYWALDGTDNDFGTVTQQPNGTITINNDGNCTLNFIPS